MQDPLDALRSDKIVCTALVQNDTAGYFITIDSEAIVCEKHHHSNYTNDQRYDDLFLHNLLLYFYWPGWLQKNAAFISSIDSKLPGCDLISSASGSLTRKFPGAKNCPYFHSPDSLFRKATEYLFTR